MPKGRKGGGGAQDSCLFPFHTVFNSAMVGGVFAFTVSPNSSLTPRGLVEADSWAHFRVKRLAFRLHPQGAGSALQVVGYVGGVQDTTPSTVAQVGELLPSTVLGGDSNVPSTWVKVSKSELAGALPWYKTIPGTAGATEEAPGSIAVAGTGTDTFCLEICGVLQFKTSVATANTPMAVMLRDRIRAEAIQLVRDAERARLLKIMSSAAPSLTSQKTAP